MYVGGNWSRETVEEWLDKAEWLAAHPATPPEVRAVLLKFVKGTRSQMRRHDAQAYYSTASVEPSSLPIARRDTPMTTPTLPSGTGSATATPATGSDGTDARIAQLEAENERLRADVLELNGMVAMLNEQIIRMESEIERARGVWSP